MVMCVKEQKNTNLSQVEIKNLIVRGRDLPRTNSTKSGAHIYSLKENKCLLCLLFNHNLEIIKY